MPTNDKKQDADGTQSVTVGQSAEKSASSDEKATENCGERVRIKLKKREIERYSEYVANTPGFLENVLGLLGKQV